MVERPQEEEKLTFRTNSVGSITLIGPTSGIVRRNIVLHEAKNAAAARQRIHWIQPQCEMDLDEKRDENFSQVPFPHSAPAFN